MQPDLLQDLAVEQQLSFMLPKEATDAVVFLSWKMKTVLYASLSVSIYSYLATMIMMKRLIEFEI